MPLDGAAEAWWIKVKDKVYGPYSRDVMARYAAEGRLVANSLVAQSPDGEWVAARECAALAALVESRPSFKSDNGDPAVESNMLVYVDMVSGASNMIEHELRRLGAAVQVSAGVYLLRTLRTAGVVRNTISQLLSHGDKMMVMDATRDRLAWFNLGPETDARIREVWNAKL